MTNIVFVVCCVSRVMFPSGISIHTVKMTSLSSSSRVVAAAQQMNRDAKEFVPGKSTFLRPEAPEFVPATITTTSTSRTLADEELINLINSASIKGIKICDIPKKYREMFGRPIDMTSVSASDISVWVRQLSLCGSLATNGIEMLTPAKGQSAPQSITEAMKLAGFNVVVVSPPPADDQKLTHVDEKPPPMMINDEDDENDNNSIIGDFGDFFVRSVIFENFVADLVVFRETIIDVVGNFCSRCETPSTAGLALSLFAAEWDRYHSVRQVFTDFKLLRDRFGATKLMPFLQAIPELEVVGTHPEVRVRIRPGFAWDCSRIIPSPRSRTVTPLSTPHNGTTTISLSSELFGPSASAVGNNRSSLLSSSSPVASTPETQTRLILEQMMGRTQSQILEILKKVPSDPIEAANAITKINELQVLVNAIKAALAVLPQSAPPTPSVNRTTISIDSLINSPQRQQQRQLLSLDTMLDLPPIDGTMAGAAPIISSPPSSPMTAAAGAGSNVGTLLSDLSRILFAQVIQQQQPGGSVPLSTVEETNAALEKTLNEIVSAASSPPSSPNNISSSGLDMSIGHGQLIIPKSLPTSPIIGLNPLMKVATTGHSTPLLGSGPSSLNTSRETLSLSSALGISDEAPTTAATTPNDTTMDTLLRGLMLNHTATTTTNISSPPGLDASTTHKFASIPLRKQQIVFDTAIVTNCIETKKVIGKNRMMSIFKQMMSENFLEEDVPKELAGLSCRQAPPRVNRRTPAELRGGDNVNTDDMMMNEVLASLLAAQ